MPVSFLKNLFIAECRQQMSGSTLTFSSSPPPQTGKVWNLSFRSSLLEFLCWRTFQHAKASIVHEIWHVQIQGVCLTPRPSLNEQNGTITFSVQFYIYCTSLFCQPQVGFTLPLARASANLPNLFSLVTWPFYLGSHPAGSHPTFLGPPRIHKFDLGNPDSFLLSCSHTEVELGRSLVWWNSVFTYQIPYLLVQST